MAISLQIVELWGVGGFPPDLKDFKKSSLNRIKVPSIMLSFQRHVLFLSVICMKTNCHLNNVTLCNSADSPSQRM